MKEHQTSVEEVSTEANDQAINLRVQNARLLTEVGIVHVCMCVCMYFNHQVRNVSLIAGCMVVHVCVCMCVCSY